MRDSTSPNEHAAGAHSDHRKVRNCIIHDLQTINHTAERGRGIDGFVIKYQRPKVSFLSFFFLIPSAPPPLSLRSWCHVRRSGLFVYTASGSALTPCLLPLLPLPCPAVPHSPTTLPPQPHLTAPDLAGPGRSGRGEASEH